MPFSNIRGYCFCNKCNGCKILGAKARTEHRKRYGVAGLEEKKEVPSAPHGDEVQDASSSSPERVRRGAPVDIGVDEETFAKDLVLLIINHGIPWKGAELIVKLVNSHVRGRILGHPLPATAYQLKRRTGCSPGDAKLFHVCPVCDFVFDDGQAVCEPCGEPPSMRIKRQLLVNDIGARIKQMFANPMLAEVRRV